MLPMFGAILPSAAAGLRPICVHVWASECTSACDCIDRISAKSPVIAARFGISPVGKRMPLMVSGLKLAGVTFATTFRSNVSVWLGAPASRMKMTFFAVFFVVTPELRYVPRSGVALRQERAAHARAQNLEEAAPGPMRTVEKRLVQPGTPGESAIDLFLFVAHGVPSFSN